MAADLASRSAPVRGASRWGRDWWLACLPALVCVLILLPRLLSAQFGLFDDGRTVTTARAVTDGVWDLSLDVREGRFRPFYWVYPSLIYFMAGPSPFWFFFGNLVLLTLAGTGLAHLVRLRGGSRLECVLAGLLLITAGPSVESYYTLSKSESLQLPLLVLSLLGMEYSGRAASPRGRLLAGAATGVAVLLSCLTKETSLVLLPIGGLWLLRAWAARRREEPGRVRSRATFLVVGLVALAVFSLLWASVMVSAPTHGTYTGNYQISLSGVLQSLIQWGGWGLRDFAYLLPLGLFLLVWGKARWLGPAEWGGLIEALIWMAGWAVVYLPWVYMEDYYLLPFAIGCALIGARAVDSIVQAVGSTARAWRAGAWAAGILAAILFATTLANNTTSARIQLAVDRANAAMLENVADRLPPESGVIVNLHVPNEYYFEIETMLHELYGRPDLNVDYFKAQSLEPLGGQTPDFIVAPDLRNEPLLTVRLGVVESTLEYWNSTLEAHLGGRQETLFETEQRVRMTIFDLPRALCAGFPQLDYCSTPGAGLIDLREFADGWRVLALQPPIAR